MTYYSAAKVAFPALTTSVDTAERVTIEIVVHRLSVAMVRGMYLFIGYTCSTSSLGL